jgi:hypothetical protein
MLLSAIENDGIMEYWGNGVMEFWSVGVMDRI